MTRHLIERAHRLVGQNQKLMPGCYAFMYENTDGDRVESPLRAYAASRAARQREVIRQAGRMAGGLDELNPGAMGDSYIKLWQGLRNEENGVPRKTGWRWSEQAKEEAAERRRRWKEAQEEREANERNRPAILAARETMEAATATARAMIPASVPPAHRESFAAWIAAGW